MRRTKLLHGKTGFSVASWNVNRCANDAKGYILEYIRGFDADAVSLQEVANFKLHDVVDDSGKIVYRKNSVEDGTSSAWELISNSVQNTALYV